MMLSSITHWILKREKMRTIEFFVNILKFNSSTTSLNQVVEEDEEVGC
jgi:hypothetical protein